MGNKFLAISDGELARRKHRFIFNLSLFYKITMASEANAMSTMAMPTH